MRNMTQQPTLIALEQQRNGHPDESHEDYGMLMSLALDNLLDASEEEALAAHLSSCSACNQQWQIWQNIDHQFKLGPAIVPVIDFASAFEERLASKERRRQAQVGLLLAILTFIVWAIGFAGIGVLLGFLVYNQIGWFGDMLHWLASAWTAMSVVGSSLWGVALGLSDSPSAIGLMVCYMLLSVAALIGWTQILRRTLRPVEVRST
jgi:hypothetical protein